MLPLVAIKMLAVAIKVYMKYQNILNQKILPLMLYAVCFSLMMKTAVFSILMAILLLLWLLSGEYKRKFASMANSPAVVAPLILFSLLAIGMFYADVSWQEKFPMFLKYHKLLYIPLVVSIVQTDQHRKYAMNAFLIGSIIVLFLSYLEFLGVIPFNDIGQGYIVTKGRIAHNLIMAFATFVMLHRMVKSRGNYRWAWSLLILMAIANIFLMVNGRTGQLIFLLLFVLFAWQIWRFASIKYLIVAGIVFFLVPKFTHFESIARLQGTYKEASDPKDSAGIRVGFYKNTIEIIKRNPLYGVGTGAFKLAYHEQVQNKPNAFETANPHNEFLLIAAEIGLIGSGAFLFMLSSQWFISYRLPSMNDGYLLQGLLLCFATGCLMNSLLLDVGEGRFYTVLVAIFLSGLKPKKSE